MRTKRFVPALLAALCLLLCACSLPFGKTTAPEPSPSPSPTPPAVSATPYDVPGEEGQPEDLAAETPPLLSPAAEGELWGSYYNDYHRCFLTLREDNSYTLQNSDGTTEGSYQLTDGMLALYHDETGARRGQVDEDGDIALEGVEGYFLRDWARWGITGQELAQSEEQEPASYSVTDNGDGSFRYRNYDLNLAFTYDAGITLLDSRFLSAAGGSDGQGGYVVGRNVTDLYRTRSGSDDEFLEDYIKTFVFRDFESFAGSLLSFSDFLLHHDAVTGRLADATLRLSSAESAAVVQVILYTSTYADGTVNYICKTVFAPDGNNGALEGLALAVRNMGAVRLN